MNLLADFKQVFPGTPPSAFEDLQAAMDAATNEGGLGVGASASVNPKDFGALGDGTGAALSSVYDTLAAAQSVYPFATSLSQTLDYCGLKAAFNVAFGGELSVSAGYAVMDDDSTVSNIHDSSASFTPNALAGGALFLRYPNGFIGSAPILSNTATNIVLAAPLPYDYHNGASVCGFIADWGQTYDCSEYAYGTGEHGDTNARFNRRVNVPAGTYVLGDDTLLVRNASSITISGAGRRATKILSNATVLKFDGLWYSRISGIEFTTQSTDSTAAFEVDGNVPGHPYATRGVQGNTFSDCLFDGGWSSYAFAMVRQGGSSGQGSENLFLNCHFQSATEAAYYQSGYNALNNTFIGGNFQGYSKNGIEIIAGQISVFSTGFQSTTGYQQIINDGWDIRAADGGTFDKIGVTGCRTESLRFYKGAGSQAASISAVLGTPSLYEWSASAAVDLDTGIIKTVDGVNKFFRVTTAGTSSDTEPTWPASGTIADGGAVWTQTDFNAIEIAEGTVDTNTVSFNVGAISRLYITDRTVEVNADYVATGLEQMITVDTTSASCTITLPDSAPTGKKYTIKKKDVSANTVTIAEANFGYIDEDAAPTVIPGGSRGYCQLERSGNGLFSERWWIVGKSF